MKDGDIIVVGTAASVLNKKNGCKIDAFDTVIKSARILNFYGYEEYVGKKTDIVWLKYRFLHDITEISDNFKGSILFLHHDIDVYREKYRYCQYLYKDEFFYNRFYIDYCFEKLQQYTDILCFDYISEEVYYKTCIDLGFYDVNSEFEKRKLNVLKGIIPSAGVRVLYYLVNVLGMSRICVTGFDFFKTRNYWEHNPHFSASPNCHSHYKEMLYYKNLLKKGIIYEL